MVATQHSGAALPRAYPIASQAIAGPKPVSEAAGNLMEMAGE